MEFGGETSTGQREHTKTKELNGNLFNPEVIVARFEVGILKVSTLGLVILHMGIKRSGAPLT
jgi:hypothetical protein